MIKAMPPTSSSSPAIPNTGIARMAASSMSSRTMSVTMASFGSVQQSLTISVMTAKSSAAGDARPASGAAALLAGDLGLAEIRDAGSS